MNVTAKSNSAGANLLKVLIAQIEQLPKPWQQMPEREQEVVIFRLREAVESGVKTLVHTLAAANFPRIPAAVESVTFKDGVKAVLKLAKSQDGTHELADATGSQAVIVIASPDEFLEGIERIRADADQAQLELAPPPDRWEQILEALEPDQPLETGDDTNPEPPPVKSMGQQAHELLAKVHVHVELDVCEAWTEQECTVAAYWALEYAKDPENCKVARPHWLPMPEPKAEDETPPAEASSETPDASAPSSEETEEHEDEDETSEEDATT